MNLLKVELKKFYLSFDAKESNIRTSVSFDNFVIRAILLNIFVAILITTLNLDIKDSVTLSLV